MTYPPPPPSDPTRGFPAPPPYGPAQAPPVVSGAPYQPAPAYPVPQGQPYGTPPPGYPVQPPPPKKGMGSGKIVLLVVAALAGLCLVGAVVNTLGGGGSTASSGGGTTVATGPAVAGEAAADPVTQPAESATPKASEFTLTPKITRKHCFGSAGCNIDFTVEMAYSGKALDDSDTWVITFEVTGDEGGPLVDQLELTGTQFNGDEQSISTPSSSTKIKIKVTGVEKQ